MCTGKCSQAIGVSLYPLSLICIAANAILFFPGWSTEPSKYPGEQISAEVRNLAGIIGGGILVLIPAIHIQATGRKGCCSSRVGMFLSILFAAIGLTGSLFCLVMSVVGLFRGPVCLYDPSTLGATAVTHGNESATHSLIWGRPFERPLEQINNESYLFHHELWSICEEPPNVVEFNVILFSIQLAAGGVEVVLCFIQMLNGLFGCICGTCRREEDEEKKELKL
ncbi:transmembrane 4 L6 family member 5-like [Spea bombifrons]|uniref:transmembrane 4 L6 family member 5-like n=1 Tax=Spea bombifrons TaxID=233779 RepID=UPI0023498CF5|nr:transmembrane 4 L6 family member 5-like [Spea bombifrons]